MFAEKDLYKGLLNMKMFVKLQAIVILQVNTKVKHIYFQIYDLICPVKLL